MSFKDIQTGDLGMSLNKILEEQAQATTGIEDEEILDLEDTECMSRSPTEIIEESEESGEPEAENDPNEPEAESTGEKGLERMSSIELAIANEKLKLESQMELFVRERERLELVGPADALQEINTRITKLQENIDELIMDDDEIYPILILDKRICDDELYSYYTTENFCVYDLTYFHTLEEETKQFNAKTKIKDIRPRLEENFCSNFPHLKDMELLPIHKNFLDTATDEQLRKKYNELLSSTNALPKNTIKRKLKEEMNKLELRNMITNTWNITHFRYPDIFGFYAKKVFFTRMQTKLGMIDEEQHYLLRLDYNSARRTFSFNRQTLYLSGPAVVQLSYEIVLEKLFKFTRDKRVVVDFEMPVQVDHRPVHHACLLISEYFCNPVTHIYEKKIILYNPNSSFKRRYKDLKIFINQEYKKKNKNIDYTWIESNKISKQYDFSIQVGPTCSLFTQKLWLLTILNPETPAEILIDYSFNQTSEDEKQYILTYYSILHFIELFMKYYPTISSKIQTLVLWDQNKQGDFVQISVSEIINKILESYLVTSNYLVNNDCPRFTLPDELYDRIASLVSPDVRTTILKYKTDKDFRKHPEDFEPLRLVPDSFMPEGDIPPSPSFGRKRNRKSKKRKKSKKRTRKSKKRKSKRKKSKRKKKTKNK